MLARALKRFTRSIQRRAGLEIKRIRTDERCIALEPEGPVRGEVLLSYTINPFLRPSLPIDRGHTADWECLQMAKTFLQLGYAVDVINYDNYRFIPRKAYAVVVDELSNLERLAPLLPPDCLRVFHAVFAHWLSNNRGSYERYAALRERRGIVLRPLRLIPPNLGIERADAATYKGNGFTESTYRYAGKPMYQVSGSSTVALPWMEAKDFDACRKRFLWLGGRGLVHKGLDVTLEAFAQMPDYSLTVCGPIHKEKDFEAAYWEELYRTPNIHTVGWVDVAAPTFAEMAEKCVGLIYPSCAEACAGSVVNSMHAGLIPVISGESGVEVRDDFGVLLGDCSVAEIRDRVQALASLPTGELRSMARLAWECARATYTRERFAQSYREAIEAIIADRRPADRPGREAIPSALS